MSILKKEGIVRINKFWASETLPYNLIKMEDSKKSVRATNLYTLAGGYYSYYVISHLINNTDGNLVKNIIVLGITTSLTITSLILNIQERKSLKLLKAEVVRLVKKNEPNSFKNETDEMTLVKRI